DHDFGGCLYAVDVQAGLVWRRGQCPCGCAQGFVQAGVLAARDCRRRDPRLRHLPEAGHRRDARFCRGPARPRRKEQTVTAATVAAGFDFIAVLPEIVLATAACAILIADLFISDAHRQVSYWLTQLGLL